MSDTWIDTAKVKKVLREVVREAGADHVAPLYLSDGSVALRTSGGGAAGAGCRYMTPDGAPDCIVGRVLAKLNLPVPDFSCTVTWSAPSLGEYRKHFNLAAKDLLSQAQSIQDQGATWGEVLDAVGIVL